MRRRRIHIGTSPPTCTFRFLHTPSNLIPHLVLPTLERFSFSCVYQTDKTLCWKWYGLSDKENARLYNYAYTDPSLESTVDNFARSARTRIANSSGLTGLQVYVSYAHGDEPVADIYGQRKLGRLRALKRMWDPRGVFDYDNPF